MTWALTVTTHQSYFVSIHSATCKILVMKIHRLCNHRAVHVYTEPRGCVKVEVAVLGSPSLIVLMVSAGVNQH